MIKNYSFRFLFICQILGLLNYAVLAQTNYMEQNFSGGGPFVSSNPDAGQFSHLVTTNEAASKFEFGPATWI